MPLGFFDETTGRLLTYHNERDGEQPPQEHQKQQQRHQQQQQQQQPLKFVVSTVSIDGESAGRPRIVAGWPLTSSMVSEPTLRAQLETAVAARRFGAAALVVAKALGLRSSSGGDPDGAAGAASADACLTKHPHAVRQGSRLGDRTPLPVWSLLVGFNSNGSGAVSGSGERGDAGMLQASALEHYIGWVSRLHVGLFLG